MISFNNETLNSAENTPLQTAVMNFDVAIATFKNLLNMAVLEECLHKEECLNKTDMEKVD